MIEADTHLFQDLEKSEQETKKRRLDQCRVNQRRIIEPIAKVQGACNQHDLRQCQGIDKGEPACHRADMLVVQDHGFIDQEQRKDHPEVQRDDQKILELAVGSLLESQIGSAHTVSKRVNLSGETGGVTKTLVTLLPGLGGVNQTQLNDDSPKAGRDCDFSTGPPATDLSLVVFSQFLHAIPSGSFPVANVVVTSRAFKSTTAILSSALTATNARAPSGCIKIPSAFFPSGSRFTSFFEATSKITRSPVPRSEISTSLPSGVNFNRFECCVFTSIVAVTFFDPRSMTQTVPSPEFATHCSLSSGERSIPSGPLPTFTFVPV